MDRGTRSELAAALKQRALQEGFSLAGITRPEPTGHEKGYRAWLDAGHHGNMGYLARPDAVERRSDLRGTLPTVRSVLVVAHDYAQADPPGVPEDAKRGVIARYARGRDYHRVVKARLLRILEWMRTRIADVEGRAYVDTGPLLERSLAWKAGLGWFGRNTMLIHPRRGSYFFIGVLLLDVDLPADPPFEFDHCGSCRACLDACPTEALLGRDDRGAPVLDARRCISYLTIESREAIPEGLRAQIGNRVYGCDICQEVCPWNARFARVSQERDYAPRSAWEAEWDRDSDDDGPVAAVIPGTDAPTLVDLMRMSEDEWDAFTRGSAMRRAGYSGLRRNVAIALGNAVAPGPSGPPSDAASTDPARLPNHAATTPGAVDLEADMVGELMETLTDEDPVVAEAAAWGLRGLARARISAQPPVVAPRPRPSENRPDRSSTLRPDRHDFEQR